MANPIIKIKRSDATTGILGTPNIPTLAAGEFGVDQINKNLYLGLQDALGAVTSVVVGGEGTFAKKTALVNGLKYKGEITITSAHLLDTDFTGTGASVWDIPETGFYYSVGSVTGNGVFKYGSPQTEITLVEGDALVKTATGWQRLVGGTALSSAISALGSVFSYKGPITNFFVPATPAATQPLDLDTLNQTTGAYYQIDYDYVGSGTNATVELTYAGLATPIKVKQGDAIVKTTTGWQKLDNVDVVVSGTTDEITVTGDENAGYVVSLTTGTAGSWKDGVEGDIDDLEQKTQNIDLTDTTAGTTRISGNVVFGPALGNHNFKVDSNGTVSINSATNNTTWNGYGTLDLQAGGGLGNLTDGFTALKAAGHLVGVDHTYGGSSQMSKIENFVIDGGSY